MMYDGHPRRVCNTLDFAAGGSKARCMMDTSVVLLLKSKLFSIPAAPGQAGQSKSVLFKRNLMGNLFLFPSRPFPARPGNENRYFSKGI